MPLSYDTINERRDARPLHQTDAAFLFDLMNDYGVRAALHLRATELGYWRRSIDFWLHSPDTEGFLVFYMGEPAAWLLLNGISMHDAQIKMLAVKPALWRHGVGMFAVGWAQGFLRDLGHERLRVQTSADNSPALNLYKKSGFEADSYVLSDIIPLWKQIIVLRKHIHA